jgi:hypothetical protein
VAIWRFVARAWLAIRVELVSGRGEHLWPRPSRTFAAARTHSFSQLAEAIDTAFARWDRAHLYQFVLGDGRAIGQPDPDDFDEEELIDGERAKLSILTPGEQFLYEFDFGDGWLHLCTVGTVQIDPDSQLGIRPATPLPYDGWGTMPDQHGRRWAEDDGEPEEPPNPGTSDLPPLHPTWS